LNVRWRFVEKDTLNLLFDVFLAFFAMMFFFFVFFNGCDIDIPAGVGLKSTYAEIDFSLVYEVENVEYTYSDTLVCQYDGSYIGGGSRIYKWSDRYKNQSKDANHIVLYEIDEQYDIGLAVGCTVRVMHNGDVHYSVDKEPIITVEDTFYQGFVPEGMKNHSKNHVDQSLPYSEAQKFLDEVNFKIIEWTCDESFKNKKD